MGKSRKNVDVGRPEEPDQDEIIEDWPMGPEDDGHKT